MNFFTKFENGWKLTKNSLAVLRQHKTLLLFPIFSGISLVLLLISFGLAVWGFSSIGIEGGEAGASTTLYTLLFGFYLVNYFIVVFFNMALVHCTHLYFNGEQPTVGKGLRFSMSRLGTIFSWAILAGTVGLLLRFLQENLGWIGKIIAGLTGIVWSVATFFAVPILAYEQVGPFEAVKRSSALVRRQWGESIGAGFSLGVIGIVGGVAIFIAFALLAALVDPMAGGIFAVLAILGLWVVLSAAQTVFISAAYHQATGHQVPHFREDAFDHLFHQK